jgi:Flp pilus assembly protein TadG
MIMRKFLANLARDTRGTMVIETAIVAPVLIVLVVGVFDMGIAISRQQELQSAASEAESIALAAASGAETNIDTIKGIIATSMSLQSNQVSVSRFYRCNANESTVSKPTSCEESAIVSSYIRIDLRDSYDPIYSQFGIGSKIDYAVRRTVQLS